MFIAIVSCVIYSIKNITVLYSMKLSRNKIAKLLKIGNQSRRKIKHKRSKSLAYNNVALLDDTNTRPSYGAAPIRARTVHANHKPLNLRFKTLKNRRPITNDGAGGAGLTNEEKINEAVPIEKRVKLFEKILYGDLYYLVDVSDISRLVSVLFFSPEHENYKSLDYYTVEEEATVATVATVGGIGRIRVDNPSTNNFFNKTTMTIENAKILYDKAKCKVLILKLREKGLMTLRRKISKNDLFIKYPFN